MPLKIFKELFVGIRTSDNVGYAVELSSKAKGKKEQQKVMSWAGGYSYQTKKTIPGRTKIVQNVLTEGFKVDRVVSRYSTSNKVWRICDPRGFILEINSQNFEDLIENCVLNCGLIQGKCLWARNGQSWSLLHEDHPELKAAKEFTAALHNDKVSFKTLKSGTVVLKNDGTELLYLGSFYGYRYSKKANNTRVGYTYRDYGQWYKRWSEIEGIGWKKLHLFRSLEKSSQTVWDQKTGRYKSGMMVYSYHTCASIVAVVKEVGKPETMDSISDDELEQLAKRYGVYGGEYIFRKKKEKFAWNNEQITDESGGIVVKVEYSKANPQSYQA